MRFSLRMPRLRRAASSRHRHQGASMCQAAFRNGRAGVGRKEISPPHDPLSPWRGDDSSPSSSFRGERPDRAPRILARSCSKIRASRKSCAAGGRPASVKSLSGCSLGCSHGILPCGRAFRLHEESALSVDRRSDSARIFFIACRTHRRRPVPERFVPGGRS